MSHEPLKELDVVKDADGYVGTILEIRPGAYIEYPSGGGGGLANRPRYEWWPVSKLQRVSTEGEVS